MMSKTHLAVGVGTALALTQPQTAKGCCLAIIGGILGGMMPDIDILDNEHMMDAIHGQIIVAGMTAAVLVMDHFARWGVCKELFSRDPMLLIWGIIAWIVLYGIGIPQPHRGFTHSLLGLIAYTIPVALILPSAVPCYVIGFASHLVMDLLNKRNIRLLFPLNWGFCFGVCYDNKAANQILLYAGLSFSLIFLFHRFFL